MNAQHITRLFYSQYSENFKYLFDNAFLGQFEMDICGVRESGYMEEFEVKLSVSDFKRDFEKSFRPAGVYRHRAGYERGQSVLKHDHIKAGLGSANRFSFVVSPSVAGYAQDNLPLDYGLIVADEYQLKVIEKPKLLHKGKITDKTLIKLLGKTYHRYWTHNLQQLKDKSQA